MDECTTVRWHMHYGAMADEEHSIGHRSAVCISLMTEGTHMGEY